MRLRFCFALPLALCSACASTSSPTSGDNGGADGGSSTTTTSSSHVSGGSSTTASTSGGGSTASGTTSGSSGGTTSGASGCGSFPLCDDFESDTVGMAPSPSLWGLTAATGCSGGAYSVTVDSSQAHSGTKSVKIVGGDSCGPLMFNSTAFGSLNGEVYGRFYVRFPAAASVPADHVAFAALGFEPDGGPLGNDQTGYLQIASIDDGTTPIMEWNFNDKELPQRDGTEIAGNVYPAANAWTCIEFHTSKSAGSVEVWVNGTADNNMTFIPGTTAVTSGNTQWSTSKPALDVQSVSLGWIHFSGAGSTTLWFDDVAIGGSRIGCQ